MKEEGIIPLPECEEGMSYMKKTKIIVQNKKQTRDHKNFVEKANIRVFSSPTFLWGSFNRPGFGDKQPNRRMKEHNGLDLWNAGGSQQTNRNIMEQAFRFSVPGRQIFHPFGVAIKSKMNSPFQETFFIQSSFFLLIVVSTFNSQKRMLE
jgi:hypothetical protein